MERALTSPKKVLGLASVILAVGLALIVVPSRQAAAAHEDCTMSVSGPFFYAGMVFPVIEVSCDSVKQTIRLDAALDMDGSQVAKSRRTCRNVSRCVTGLARDGIFAMDIPGNQHWCGQGSASVRSKGSTRFFPEVTSCESEDF
jgi:hypothetical protein